MIKAIFAVDYWGGMGQNGSLPWPHHSEDLQYFKEQTKDQIVVMGRRTWDDPKTTKPLFGYQGVKTVRGDLSAAVKKIAEDNPTKTVWVIGGPGILMETRDLIDEAHVTHFKGQFKTDTQIDLRRYLSLFRASSANASTDRKCTWTTYKNIDIFRPV